MVVPDPCPEEVAQQGVRRCHEGEPGVVRRTQWEQVALGVEIASPVEIAMPAVRRKRAEPEPELEVGESVHACVDDAGVEVLEGDGRTLARLIAGRAQLVLDAVANQKERVAAFALAFEGGGT